MPCPSEAGGLVAPRPSAQGEAGPLALRRRNRLDPDPAGSYHVRLVFPLRCPVNAQPLSADGLLEKCAKHGERSAEAIFRRVARALASLVDAAVCMGAIADGITGIRRLNSSNGVV
jgi:hypothetical protein